MAGRVDASRDLLLGIYALETGAIDREQLVSTVVAWSRSSSETLRKFLSDQNVLDASTLADLDERVRSDLAISGDEPPAPSTATGSGTPPVEVDATATYTPSTNRSGRSLDELAGQPIGGGRFEIVRPHARGGLGEVFVAFDRELNRSVALKELQARRAHDPDSQARFLMEAEVTGRLEHPGIVPVYSLGRYADARPYYAMRLIEGETFRSAIERFHRMGTSAQGRDERELAFRRLLRSLIDACNAVAYAHSRGVVHRDLKPENIMLGPFGETIVVDWGVAKSRAGTETTDDEPESAHRSPNDASMTQPGSVIGTPRYMSPEQADGDLDRVRPASDIYSLGAILYCVLVGHSPFPDGDVATVLDRARRGIFPAPRRVRRTVDPALEAICLKAMALDPGERHATALELAHDLEAWQADVRFQTEQEQALNQVKGSLTRLCLERARAYFDGETHAQGMLWLARALENAPSEPPDLERVVRTSLSGWHAGAKLLERSFRHNAEVETIAFSPETKRLATGCVDGSARIWDVSTGSLLSSPLPHDGPVRALAFSPDGATLATAGDDGVVLRWHAVTGERVGKPFAVNAPVSGLSFSPDGSRLAVVGAPVRSFLWDVATQTALKGAGKNEMRTVAAAFSADGSTVAAAGDDGEVRLLNSGTGRRAAPPLAHDSVAKVLVFDSSGRILLTGCVDGHVRLWDLAQRAASATLPHPGAILGAAFRPDGEAFATACDEGPARLWACVSGEPIGEPLAHRARVDRLAFRPDGTMVATGSADGTLRFWCATTGLAIGPPLAQGGAIKALIFGHDGRRLATAGSDATVRCWQVPNAVEGSAERLACWVRVVTDLEFDAGDAIRPIDGPQRWELRRRLSDLGGPPLR